MDSFFTLVGPALDFLAKGGPTLMAIAVLSVLTLTVILWKVWRLMRMGAWSKHHSKKAINAWLSGDEAGAIQVLDGRDTLRANVARAAMTSAQNPLMSEDQSREETTRIARNGLNDARSSLRMLELISTIAPLLGLLGTVIGMIAAFQALQDAGARANPSDLAGGIWEALLTTAAGMAVAIPASAALTWFESVVDFARQDMEDLAARMFTHVPDTTLKAATE